MGVATPTHVTWCENTVKCSVTQRETWQEFKKCELYERKTVQQKTHTRGKAVSVTPQSVTSQSPTLPPVDWSPPGFPVRGILQASILEWVAISCSRDCKATVLQSNMKKERKKENKSTRAQRETWAQCTEELGSRGHPATLERASLGGRGLLSAGNVPSEPGWPVRAAVERTAVIPQRAGLWCACSLFHPRDPVAQDNFSTQGRIDWTIFYPRRMTTSET